jgi:hypothetical protein
VATDPKKDITNKIKYQDINTVTDETDFNNYSLMKGIRFM